MKRAVWFVVLIAATAAAQVSLPNPQSRVAGRFVAFNYGGWAIPLYTVPSGTGSHTFAPLYDTVTLSDGRRFVPFATNAPLYVGSELVTVTAVGAGCVPNNTIPGGCVLTATFSSTHTNAENLRSGTFGLQEALDDAGSSGGGAVVVDSAWAGSGGTTAMVSAATLPTSTGIEDARTGAPAASVNGVPITPSSVAATTTISAAQVQFPAINPSAAYFYGDSNTSYPSGTTCYFQGQSTCWPNRVAAIFGIIPVNPATATFANRAYTGDQACDAAAKLFTYDYPSPTAQQPFRAVMIGTNDANTKGAGAYEATFNTCDQGFVSWSTVPSNFKVLASTGTTSGTCSSDTTYAAATGEKCTANASTITVSLTTTGGPVYIWPRYIDSDAGTWTYAIDGGSAVSVSTALTTAISTLNSLTTAPGLIRVTGVAAGAHSIVFTQTHSGTMSIMGVGTPSNLAVKSGLPYLADMAIFNQFNGVKQSDVDAYNADISANLALLTGDGLQLYYVPTNKFVQMTTAANDDEPGNGGLHINAAGGGEVAQAVFYPFKAVPGIGPSTASGAVGARIVTSSTTLLSTDSVIYTECVSACTITMPATGIATGQIFWLYYYSGSVPTIAPGSDASGPTLALSLSQGITVSPYLQYWYLLQSTGSTPASIVTADYTIANTDSIIYTECVSACTITMPASNIASGKVFLVSYASGSVPTIAPGAGASWALGGSNIALTVGQTVTVSPYTIYWFVLQNSGGITPATTGQRFLCITTTGYIVSSATACSGT